MDCEANPIIFTQFGWKCNTTFTNLDVNSKFFIRCQDTSENKNTMSESYIYEFLNSESDLEITDIIPEPGETTISGVEPVSKKLRLRTSGGAKDGEAVCSWDGNGYGDRFNYDNENGSTSHDYNVRLGRGQYNLKFFCEDVAGNTAENSTNFVIQIDKFGPKITRIYYDGGLKITTSEPSECKFGFKNNFNFENATEFSGKGLEHLTGWNTRTYFVQCVDQYGNKGTKVKVKPVGTG